MKLKIYGKFKWKRTLVWRLKRFDSQIGLALYQIAEFYLKRKILEKKVLNTLLLSLDIHK